MLHEKSCGGIVYRKYHGNTEILLIKHINSGHWSFPKGHVEGDETEIETAKREIMEETGIDVNLDPTFREIVTYSPRKDTQKIVVYFIAKAKNTDFVPQEEEIAEIKCRKLGGSLLGGQFGLLSLFPLHLGLLCHLIGVADHNRSIYLRGSNRCFALFSRTGLETSASTHTREE